MDNLSISDSPVRNLDTLHYLILPGDPDVIMTALNRAWLTVMIGTEDKIMDPGQVLVEAQFGDNRVSLGGPKGFRIHGPEEQASLSPGSEAKYLASWNWQNDPSIEAGGGLLMYALYGGDEDRVETSNHFHHQTVEKVIVMRGSPQIKTGGGDWKLPDKDEVITIDTNHSFSVQDGLAIVLIRIQGPHSVLCRRDHWYYRACGFSPGDPDPNCRYCQSQGQTRAQD